MEEKTSDDGDPNWLALHNGLTDTVILLWISFSQMRSSHTNVHDKHSQKCHKATRRQRTHDKSVLVYNNISVRSSDRRILIYWSWSYLVKWINKSRLSQICGPPSLPGIPSFTWGLVTCDRRRWKVMCVIWWDELGERRLNWELGIWRTRGVRGNYLGEPGREDWKRISKIWRVAGQESHMKQFSC